MSRLDEKNSLDPAQIRSRLAFDDARLLGECEVHTHRVGGPGGQHRNKTETAIRLVHRPSGIVVSAGETRSQHENRVVAIRRLREAIAVAVRVPAAVPIEWPDSVSIRERRLRVNPENPGFAQTVAIVLDHIAAHAGEIAPAAAALGVTSSNLTRFLAAHPRAWIGANELRQRNGLHNLKRDK